MSARRARPASASTARDSRSASGSHLGHVSTALPPGLRLGSSPSAAALPSSRPRSRDSEDLTADVRSLKTDVNAVRAENAYLKSQLQRLLAQLRRKDKQLDQLCALKISAVSDAGGDAIVLGQIRELRSEMTTIARLTEKFRDVESSLQRRDEELRRIRSSTKVLAAAEAEMEAQLYYNEARRMKAGLTMLQTQVTQLSAQLREAQGLRPGELRYQRPQSASPYNSALSPSAAAANAARDHEIFKALRAEVETLRAENRRLQAEAASSNGAEEGANRHSSLHVLNTREAQRNQQQRSQQTQSSANGVDDADYASDSADYEQLAVNGQEQQQQQQGLRDQQDQSYSHQPQQNQRRLQHQADDDGGVPEHFEEAVDE